jgi:hypothetical protein
MMTRQKMLEVVGELVWIVLPIAVLLMVGWFLS